MIAAPAITDDAGLLRDLAVELRRQLETKRDLMADTRLSSLHVGGEDEPPLALVVDLPGGAEAFEPTRLCHQQIAAHLDVPWRTYERLLAGIEPKDGSRKRRRPHPDLLAHLCNGLFARENSTRMIRTMDGKARAFLSNSYQPRDNWDLLDTAVLPVLAEFPGRIQIKECTLTETNMYVKLFLPDLAKQVTPKVGDVVRGGAIIQNSEVGLGQCAVYPYTDVLWCTNGAVHTEFGQGQRHVGRRITGEESAWEFYSDATKKLDDAAFFAKVADTLRGVLNETVFDAIVAQMRDLAGMPLADAPKAVEVIVAKHSLTEGEGESMLADLIARGEAPTAWGLVNAVTATARDTENADRKVELEVLAGNLTSDRTWMEALAA